MSKTVRLRRLVARRPWIQWVVIVGLAVATATSVEHRLDAVDVERSAWGRPAAVWVATAPAEIGEAIRAERRSVPVAVTPDGAITDDPSGKPTRRALAVGEIVTGLDVTRGVTAPAGWLVVPVREEPASGAGAGDRVVVVADGLVVAAEAVVVATDGDVTLLAAPAVDAPFLPVAPVTLLRRP